MKGSTTFTHGLSKAPSGEIKTEEKELNKIIDALTRNYKITDAYKEMDLENESNKS